MVDKAPEVAVLVLTVEQQAEHPLITVTVQRHLGRSLTSAEPPVSQHVPGTAEVVRLVKQFLRSLT